jgi:hypothetical protein
LTAAHCSAPVNLGFLTIRHDAGGFIGGYLVTNAWGRPLEFRMSTAVQPNRVQQILYADTLAEYLSADIIGKTLIEKTATPAQVILTDTFEALSLRRCQDLPVIWVAPSSDPRSDEFTQRGAALRPAERNRGPLVTHPEYPDDVARLRELFERLSGLDFVEPFTRIRDAVTEARKMGVMQRAG